MTDALVRIEERPIGKSSRFELSNPSISNIHWIISMNKHNCSRRHFLQKSAGIAGAAAMGTPLFSQNTWANELNVGFIYVGPRDDFGYNQAHAEGAEAIKSIDGVKVVEEENVPESVDVQKTMESMINFDGTTLLFPTSFGYFDPHILEVAPKKP